MKARSSVEFLGFWEQINNPDFNRVEFDTFKNEAGSNAFVLTPQKWIKATGAIGIISKAGRYGGGTFAHKDIAFEFASWISAEFKLYIIKEFQRLKQEEQERKELGWDVKRFLVKANYKVHTDAVNLTGLESLNAEFIRQGMRQKERLKQLNRIAILQMKSLSQSSSVKKLK